MTLQGNDPDGDALTFKIVSPPAKGALFQYAFGLRGPPILLPEAPVTDAAGRVIFAPGTNEVGMGYAATQFRADDGLALSAAATVTFNVLLPAPPQILSATSRWNNGAFQFNFLGTTTANYGVWASTNLKDWSFLGPAQETDPGLYQFIDTPPPNSPWRFYRCQAP